MTNPLAGLLLLPFVLLLSCSQGPYAELDPDAFVSPSSDHSWEASSNASDALQTPSGMGITLDRVVEYTEAPTGEQSLLHLTDFALRNRPETRAAWERSRMAAAQYGMVRGAWYPTLGIDADLSFNRIMFPATGEAFFIEQFQFIPTLNLNYLLLDFGRREADDDAARAKLWAANLEFDRAIQQTIHDVQINYFGLDAALALNEAAQRNLDLAQTVVDMVEQQLIVGLATMPEMLFARQSLAQARFDLESTVAGISVAQSALLKSCGLPSVVPITIARLKESSITENLGIRVEDVITQALSSRPDLAAAVSEVKAAQAQVARAEAEFMPQVSVFGSLGGIATRYQTQVTDSPNAASNETFPWTNAATDLWSVGLSGSWMIFEGFQRENSVRFARAARREAEENLRSLRLAAISDTWDAYFRVQAAARQYEFGEALLESSEESFAAVQASFMQGLATITQLVQAEKDLQDARSTLVNTRADLLTSASDLAFAAGAESGRFVPAEPSREVAVQQ